jgi:polyisoprenoid-binding protein YceI
MPVSERPVTYRIVSDASEVAIHARSTLHAIDGTATDVGGTVDLGTGADGSLRLHGGRIEVPVGSLRSGNPLEDAELQRRIDARRFPTIVGEVRSATAIDGEAGAFRVEGDVTFHGVTNPITGELRVARDGDRVRIEGERVFDVRQFDIKPPRILMLRVEPDVRVTISLVAERD